jgi:hypothetical protein
MQNSKQIERHMTHSQLKQAILDTIRCLYGKDYIAPIHIRDLEPIGYEIAFEHHQYHPVFISAELPDKEFLKFLEDELRRKSFLLGEYF